MRNENEYMPIGFFDRELKKENEFIHDVYVSYII